MAALLVCVGLAGVVLPAVPCTIFLISGLILAAWTEDFRFVALGTIIVLVILTLITYIIDIVAAAFGARQFGASELSAVGAFIGILFKLPGILLGPFLGAVTGELLIHDNIMQAGRQSWCWRLAVFAPWRCCQAGIVLRHAGSVYCGKVSVKSRLAAC